MLHEEEEESEKPVARIQSNLFLQKRESGDASAGRASILHRARDAAEEDESRWEHENGQEDEAQEAAHVRLLDQYSVVAVTARGSTLYMNHDTSWPSSWNHHARNFSSWVKLWRRLWMIINWWLLWLTVVDFWERSRSVGRSCWVGHCCLI